MRRPLSRRRPFPSLVWVVAWLSALCLAGLRLPAWGAELTEAQIRALNRASDAVVGVRSVAVDGAVSTVSLGAEREGSGVVIGADDLVLTIGYLVLEADQVDLVLDDGRVLPARVVANDEATGFALLQSLAPLGLQPVPFGRSTAVQPNEPLLIVTGGENGGVQVGRLAARRAFDASWEYRLDNALFTTPPLTDHSGAALFNARGELLGVGALLVHDVAGGPPGVESHAGNLFVPIDLLPPILADLRQHGRSRQSHRAWLGVDCVERAGEVHVAAVAARSPAARGGLQAGDRIEGIDGQPVTALGALWSHLWSGGPPARTVTLQVRRGDLPLRLELQTIDVASVFKQAEGI